MNIYKLLLLLVIGFSSCESQILDLDSLTEPVDDIFYKNEEELNLALNHFTDLYIIILQCDHTNIHRQRITQYTVYGLHSHEGDFQ